ncbi:HAMP domain-containing protein [Wukongibacter baidiensis]|uniref:HAMP domain-containing protein n=1 Tax=Wukongibacter baidiensis TaxID=1723361 RepID=UPI003D7F26C2
MKKYLVFLAILIVMISISIYFLWEYNYFLNEPLSLKSYPIEEIENKNIEITPLSKDSEDGTFYHAKLNKTNISMINVFNKTIKKGKDQSKTFYIDTSQNYVVKVDDKDEIVTLLNWDEGKGSIVDAIPDNKGNVFVQWVKYDPYNLKVELEGISIFSNAGHYITDIFRKNYSDLEYPEGTYVNGLIENLQYENNKVYFFYQANEKLHLYSYDKSLNRELQLERNEEEFEFIDLIGTSPGKIYFATKDSKFGLIDKNKKVVYIKEYLKEKKVIGSIFFDEGENVNIELLNDDGAQIEKYNGVGFTSVASTAADVKEVISKNTIENVSKDIKFSDALIRKKILVLLGYLAIIGLILYLIRFIYTYILQRKIYIVFKQLIVLIPIILIGMLVFVLNTIFIGFEEFSDEIKGGKYYQFNHIIDEKLELIENRTNSPYYLGDLIDSLDVYEDINKDVYNEIYNLTKLTDVEEHDDIKGMYIVIDKVKNGNVYKIFDTENKFKLFYPRFARGDNEYFRAASKGEIVNAVGTGERYIFTMKPIYNSKRELVGICQVGMNYEGYRRGVDMKMFTTSIIRILTITLAVVFAIILTTSIILKPLQKLTKNVKEVADGNLDIQVKVHSKDEIEDLSDTFNIMTSNIKKHISNIQVLSKSYYRFVPQEILQLLNKESVDEIELGEHKRFNMCILSAGIEDFYQISKKTSTEDSFQFINEYLEIVGPIIRKNKGVIEKYLDKGVIAIFPKSSKHAIKAAKEIIKEVNKYNLSKKSKLPLADIRIAIHKGPVLVGIIGEERRLQSSLVSDHANLVGVIRDKASALWSNIIVTEEVINDIKKVNFSYRKLGKISIANGRDIVQLYDIYDADKEEQKKLKEETKSLFEKSIEEYAMGKFYDARSGFVKILEKNIEDNASRVYFYQSDECYRNGTDEKWNQSIEL